MDKHVDEDLIEATIKRVAEARAARVEAPDETQAPPAASGDAPSGAAEAGPADRIRASGLIADGAPAVGESAAPAAPDAETESAIEATIRRVAAAKAAREQASVVPPGDEGGDGEAAATTDRPLTVVRRTSATAAPAVATAQPALEDWAAALDRIERAVSETRDMLRSLVSHVAALAGAAGNAAPRVGPAPRRPDADDGWEDEAPQLPRVPFGALPRPSVLRDPAQRPAMAERAADHDAGVSDAPPPPLAPAPLQPDQRRGFDLLPRTYRITVEDKRRGVDLVPLHRALLAMDGVRDMSLLSYNNGVAIVSLETVSDIDTGVLERSVSRAMSRPATVETHNDRTLVVKLAEE
ncbi:MAG: hypothetical protein KGK07_10180 [Chloroflexota bacterium]|nr:hypothetical protein [Chloroflexota bacterium]